MDYKAQLRKNIRRDYIYTLLQNIDLTRGIWMIYLAYKGMSLTQLGLLETIFHMTSFLMEVPTGAVADIFGRRVSRIAGRVLSLISVVILLAADSFLWFAISFVFTALSYNLESGAGDALLYDSLKEIGEENKYMKISGKKEVFLQIAGVVSFLAGGWMASKSYGIAFGITIVVGAATLVQSFSFREPCVDASHEAENKKGIFVKQLKASIKVVKSNPRIGFLILFMEIIMTFSTCIFYYLQNFLKGDGYNEAVIGLIYAASYVASALTAPQVHKIERLIKEQGILLITPFVIAASLLGIGLSSYYFIFFIALMVSVEIVFVVMNDYINKLIPSENRATILSFASMVFSLFMITLFPLVGFLGDRYSLGFAIKCLGGLSIIFALINSFVLWILRR
jgi:MFS family permease